MEESPSQLTFIIPASLVDASSRNTSLFSCLETLIARGDITQSATSGDEQLLELFGGATHSSSARAAVSHFAQHGGGDREQWRIIATPIHLLADQATLHFPQQHPSLLSGEESLTLLGVCQDYFAEEGWQLDYGDVNQWYLSITSATEITTTSPEQATGRSLFETLPQGEDAPVWRRWSNEVQMLLHTHPVNEQRRGRGEPVINSLWFWGEGYLPERLQKRFSYVMGGDHYVQGLAQLSDAHWSGLPKDLASLDSTHLQGPTLIVLDEHAISQWDEQWFCSLRELLQRKTVRHVTLCFSDGYRVALTSAVRWRLWRRKHLTVQDSTTA